MTSKTLRALTLQLDIKPMCFPLFPSVKTHNVDLLSLSDTRGTFTPLRQVTHAALGLI